MPCGVRSELLRPAAFEDALMQIWAAQQELTWRIRDLLDTCGFEFSEYADWFNDYCLGENDQISRLVEEYKEKFNGRDKGKETEDAKADVH